MKSKSWAAIGIILLSIFTLTACSKGSDGDSASSTGDSASSTAAPASYSISGTVTVDGVALQGVSITLSGDSSATMATDASGNYTFANLSAGSYTVTPSLAGYAFSPSSPTINITDANQSQDFTAASVVASYSISGTISYSGSHTGRIYVGLKNANGSAIGHGTSIASPGAFIIHGVIPGIYYKLSAEMDIRNDGTLNADNPSGEILTITITGASLTNQNITLTDPASAAPVTPTGLHINPGDGVALIRWDNMTSNYKTIAESYKIYWGTDVAATSGTPVIVQASHNMYLQSIANGNYYFKISAIAGGTESAASAVIGPVTISAGTGVNTVSGTVTSPVTPSGPLYVGLYAGHGIYYITKITSAGASQAYSIAGVPNGIYRAFAFLDQNNNCLPDSGDVMFDTSGALPVVINNNNPTADITLSSAGSRGNVATEHWIYGSSSGYILNFTVGGMMNLPAGASIASGQNIPVPLDMQKENFSTGGFSCPVNLGTVSPSLTDSYRFDVSYYAGAAEQMTAPVTAVLDSFAQNPAADATNIPTFSWSAPASPPAFYSYYIAVYDATTGNLVWYYPGSTPFGMPSTQTSVLYNVDGTASQSSLTIGTKYDVYVIVMDAYLNTAWYGFSDTPTTAAYSGSSDEGVEGSSSIVVTGSTSLSGVVSTSTTLTGSVSINNNIGVSGSTTISGTVNITAH